MMNKEKLFIGFQTYDDFRHYLEHIKNKYCKKCEDKTLHIDHGYHDTFRCLKCGGETK